MAIELKCSCGGRFQVENQYVGCRVRCPECKRISKVPRLKRKQKKSNAQRPLSFEPKDQDRFELSIQTAGDLGLCKDEIFSIIHKAILEHLEHECNHRGSLIVTITDWVAIEDRLRMSLTCVGSLNGEEIYSEAKINQIARPSTSEEKRWMAETASSWGSVKELRPNAFCLVDTRRLKQNHETKAPPVLCHLPSAICPLSSVLCPLSSVLCPLF